MNNICKCDRCGKEGNTRFERSSFGSVKVIMPENWGKICQFDLCDNCFNEWKKSFLNLSESYWGKKIIGCGIDMNGILSFINFREVGK